MNDAIFTLPIELQVALGGGYIAHSVAYAGLRKSTGATELALRSLAFGLAAMLAFRITAEMSGSQTLGVIAGILAAVILGALWRGWGMNAVQRIMRELDIYREDGLPDAWTAIIQTKGLNVTQLSVRTTDGRTLFHNRAAYGEALQDGLYFGSDGSLFMVIEEERLADGTERKAEDVTVENWGTRLTYIPASQIAQVNLRTPTIPS